MKLGLIGIYRYADYLSFACNLHAYAFQQDLREPAKFAEAKYRTAIAAKASTPAAVKDRNTAARKWAVLAMRYRALTQKANSGTTNWNHSFLNTWTSLKKNTTQTYLRSKTPEWTVTSA